MTFPVFVTPAIRALAWIRTEGLEHLESVPGPAIFACNHQSHLDTHIFLEALPPKWRYRTTVSICDEIYGGRQAWMRAFNKARYAFSVLHMNGFTLPRTAAFRRTLEHTRWLAESGWSILIYPEGERSSTGRMLPLQKGIARIASFLHLPVVPVRLEGAVLQRSGFGFRPGPVRVRFGAPFYLQGSDYRALTSCVEQAIRELSSESQEQSVLVDAGLER